MIPLEKPGVFIVFTKELIFRIIYYMSNLSIFSPPSNCERPYTVSEINDGVTAIIESHNTLIWIEGEISNWKSASSGHCYFKLKDSESQIPAVLWGTTFSKLSFIPEDGMAVTAICSLRVYRKAGYYQLEVHQMKPAGDGALYLAFEKLKKKLEAEGLFDTSHKKKLPETVETLGIITSKAGAVLHDIIKVASSRAPQTDILLRSVSVQGANAAKEIAVAIADMNEYGIADIIILGRGGGSIEDLCAFNDEIVVRAIYNSEIPVISAVGHETDFTLSDFVADVRAPTPSAAAEIALPDTVETKRYFNELIKRFSASANNFFQSVYNRYNSFLHSYAMRKPLQMLADARQDIDSINGRVTGAICDVLRKKMDMFSMKAAQLHALNPLAVLSRGYSVVTDSYGVTIRDSSKLHKGDTVTIKFYSGSASAVISNTTKK